jgi:hypothetical protein
MPLIAQKFVKILKIVAQLHGIATKYHQPFELL